VLSAIQEVIDASHLPFADRDPRWQTDLKGAADESGTDARVAKLRGVIEDVQRDNAPPKDASVIVITPMSGLFVGLSYGFAPKGRVERC
jgi:hypothetical protein